MNKSKKVYLVLALALGFTALLYALVTFFVNEKFEDLQSKITLQIAEQQTLLTTISETTARNGADSVTESIVLDCNLQERTDFDSLLGRLDKGLSKEELTTLERLFGRCGNFYAARKSVMVTKLEREIEIYTSYVDQLDAVSDEDVNKLYKVETWKKLSREEKTQSELFTSLVKQQDKIITTLLQGKSASSEEMKEILQEVKETQEMLVLTNRQAADTRAELLAL